MKDLLSTPIKLLWLILAVAASAGLVQIFLEILAFAPNSSGSALWVGVVTDLFTTTIDVILIFGLIAIAGSLLGISTSDADAAPEPGWARNRRHRWTQTNR